MGSETSSIRRHDRTLVFLAVVAVIASLFAYTAAQPARVFAEGAGPLDHFTVEFTGTATAGSPITVTVTARDADETPVEDYPGGAVFDATLGAGCSGTCDAVYGSLSFVSGIAAADVTPYLAETGVVLSVTDAGIGKTGATGAFDVGPGVLTSIEISPEDASITADDGTQSYTTEGFDAYGNSRGDVTGATTFDIDGTACSGSDCGSTTVGDYIVMGTSGGFTDATGLTVTPGVLTSIEISPEDASITADDGTQSYTTEGFDAYGNSRGDVTGATTFDIDGTACSGSDCGSTTVGDYIVMGTSGGFTDATGLTVTPGALDQFTFDTIATQVAGTPFGFEVKAWDAYGNIKTDYAGGAVLSGLASSPGCAFCAPSFTGADATYGAIVWSQGVGTVTGVIATNAQGGAQVTATDGGVSDPSGTFEVTHSAVLGGITIDTIADQIAGTAFSVTVRAFDEFGNVKLDQSGGSLSGLADSPGCGGCDPAVPVATPEYGTFSWTNGVATVTGVNAKNAQAAASISATVGSATNSASFEVTHSAVLGGITIDTIADQIAGTAFSVTVRAFDEFGNVKLDQSGGSLSGLESSPGCGSCQPAVAVTDPDHGTLAWTDGVATASLTAVKARSGVTVAASVGSRSNTSNAFTVAPGPLGGFVIGSILSPRTAGAAFTVSATAYDVYGNTKTDYAGGATLSSTLASSPNGTAPTVPNVLTWGSGTGAGTTSVTAVKAELAATQTVTLTDGTVAATSAAFAVNPASVDSLHFSTPSSFYDPNFNGQPIDTKVGAPIYSVCTPPAASATNPCGLAPAVSTGVRVLALDRFGNRVVDGTTITLGNNPSSSGLASAATVNGVADFGNDPVITALGNFRLKAESDAKTVISEQRRIVHELVACTGQVCENNVGNGSPNLQRAYGKIRTGSTFFQAGETNVLLTTQFLPGSETNRCQGNQTIGQSTDLRVQGLGVGDTAPSTQMVLILPRETMMSLGVTSRGTGTFNVCLGVITVDGSTPDPWKAKDPKSKKFAFKSAELDTDEGRYWGVPADCGATVVTKGRVETLSESDPCIGLRSKLASEVQAYLGMTSEEFAALGVRDADLVIVIEKRSPWDGKGGVY